MKISGREIGTSGRVLYDLFAVASQQDFSMGLSDFRVLIPSETRVLYFMLCYNIYAISRFLNNQRISICGSRKGDFLMFF